MVSCRVNPACRTEFKPLNTGYLYALERRSADTEFFWLCSACALVVALSLDVTGGVSVRARSNAHRSHPPLIWTVVFGWLLAPPWNVHHGIGPTAPTGQRLRAGPSAIRSLHHAKPCKNFPPGRDGRVRKRLKPMQTPMTGSITSFKNVLLATDFSAASYAAFQTALGVCTEFGASLLILHVFEYADAVPPETGGQLVEQDSIYESARNSLAGLSHLARREGVTCATIMGSGIPSEGVLKTITSKEIDLAILGTNAIHGFERLAFGSTAEAVLRKALCPVLTVGPQASDAARAGQLNSPVVFATDFHLKTTYAIRDAAFFCKVTGSPLHCLHVFRGHSKVATGVTSFLRL